MTELNRGKAVYEHLHFTEPVDVVSSELDYIGTSDIPAGAAKYHQYDDVIESVADVSFV